jgi:DNA-binding MarR family transcriptional regulator
MTERPLSKQQETRLVLAARGFISSSTERSMPSLARRGLVEKYWETYNGRRCYNWRVTDAGHAEARRISAREGRNLGQT